MNKMTKVSADEIVKALLFEANETANKIIKDTENAAQNILEEQRKTGRERAKEIVTSVAKKAQNDSNIIKLRETASAENEAKWLILEKKHALIENVLNQVKDELRTLIKSDQYIHVLENLIVEGGIIVGETDLEVILNERDSTLPLDLDKLAEMISIKTGKITKITKSQKNIDALGGAIIQTPNEDKLKEFYDNYPSLRLIPETGTLVKFRNVMKNFVEKQLLPNIEDPFKLKSLEDMLNSFKRIHSLEDRISEFYIESTPANYLGNGKIVMNNTFEALLKYSESEIRFKIAKILFAIFWSKDYKQDFHGYIPINCSVKNSQASFLLLHIVYGCYLPLLLRREYLNRRVFQDRLSLVSPLISVLLLSIFVVFYLFLLMRIISRLNSQL